MTVGVRDADLLVDPATGPRDPRDRPLLRRERIALRNATERATRGFDWARLSENYHRAHSLALERVGAALGAAGGAGGGA